MRLSFTTASVCVAIACTSSCLATPVRRGGGTSSIISDASSLNGTSYDFIIVGGGLTGLVAAARLSEDSSKRVLVIEAGDDTRNDDKVSSLNAYQQAYGDKRYDWAFKVADSGRVLHQGRGLGGSTSINGAAFTLPPSTQLDAIGVMGNGNQWSSAALQPYMRAYQKYHAPTSSQNALGLTADMSSHGASGPVDIGFNSADYSDEQQRAFITAQQQALNAPKINDLGSGESGGAALIANTVQPDSGNNRVRVSSATAYLTSDVQSRRNLVVLIKTRASAMLYSGDRSSGVEASGVQLQAARDGPTYTVNARKVIVAAGAIRTPVFLQHSGIGERALLQSLGITTQVDLPGVGKNLCEQQANNIYGAAPKNEPSGGSSAIGMNTIAQLMSNASSVRTYMESNIDGWAQSAVDAGAAASKSGLLLQYRTLINGIFDKQWPVAEMFFIPTSDTIILQMWALLSFSRGYVKATSASTWDVANVNARYWSAPIDMDMQVAANRAARRVMQSDAFKGMVNGDEQSPGFDARNGGIPAPAASPNHGSYARWQAYIMAQFSSVAHPIGTAAMLPREQGGVVDSGFKVYGTQNVFVIDSSVLPMQQSTHLSGVLYAVAEKAADVIKRV